MGCGAKKVENRCHWWWWVVLHKFASLLPWSMDCKCRNRAFSSDVL